LVLLDSTPFLKEIIADLKKIKKKLGINEENKK